jgi:energy-coupling factor transporter transmembrane protein EcfT
MTILLIGIFGNIIWQVFCIPTTWAMILLSICFINTILYPLTFRHKKNQPIQSFISGISFIVFIYCIIFLAQMNWLGLFAILFFGLGLLTFIPHYFALQLLWNNLIKPKTSLIKYFFITGVIVSILVSGYFGYQYKIAISEIEQFKDSNYIKLKKSFMTEKILGMHFIYHTRFCEYDGWRPPKHDPSLVIGMWYNKGYDPLSKIRLEKRVNLYKKFYPNRKIKYNCSCAWFYKNDYHNDEIWK